MTTPYFQVALNSDLTKDATRRKKAMKVLNTMLSKDAQNRVISDGQDLLSYSQDVDLKLTEYLKDVKPVIEENHTASAKTGLMERFGALRQMTFSLFPRMWSLK